MNEIRLFHVTSERNQEGVIYGYRKSNGVFCSLEIKGYMDIMQTIKIKELIYVDVDAFLEWVQKQPVNVIELRLDITFEMFWDKYNDKVRSSRKRSQRLWDKLKKEDQVQAYYYHDTYNRNRGNAEKKYCETYLSAEMWNN